MEKRWYECYRNVCDIKADKTKNRRNICSMKKIKEVEKREERRRQAKIKSDCIHNKKCNENDK